MLAFDQIKVILGIMSTWAALTLDLQALHPIEEKKTVLLADYLCCGCHSPCAFKIANRKMQLVSVHSCFLAVLAPCAEGITT